MKKWRVVGLFWWVQVFTDIIRVSLAMALGGALSYVFLVKSFEPLPIDVSHSVG